MMRELLYPRLLSLHQAICLHNFIPILQTPTGSPRGIQPGLSCPTSQEGGGGAAGHGPLLNPQDHFPAQVTHQVMPHDQSVTPSWGPENLGLDPTYCSLGSLEAQGP